MFTNIAVPLRPVTTSERMPTYVTFIGGAYPWPQTHLVEHVATECDFVALQNAVLDREYKRGLGTYFHNRL